MFLDITLRGSPYVQRIEVLDDTGSSCVELFDDDCVVLGFDSPNPPISIFYEWTMLSTANGDVLRTLIQVMLQSVAPDGTTIGEPVPVIACLVPELQGNTRPKCSGSALPRTLFTATAPGDIGNETLIVDTNQMLSTLYLGLGNYQADSIPKS